MENFHAWDDLLVDVIKGAGAAFGIDGKENAARLQYAEDFPDAFVRILPEVHRFRCHDEIEAVISEGENVCRSLIDVAASVRNGFAVQCKGHGYRCLGRVDACHMAFRCCTEKALDIPASAASDIQDVSIVMDFHMGQSPARQGNCHQIHTFVHSFHCFFP